ncbi:hypothetical protein BAUCODRAFT_226886 [Baudoinia panamericana UAMH 10762]|uniref:Uncharacterized protein n=1 Tax=Baudoinia panamericana (strain UAMH 10762) TaxID=717646 RepID=M2N5D4_BAUPA|nr:uncharacterized protein BAUCODRAFT_226886 [Baudoinia panamericana UAMH 10762]EMC94254.1 hypothetical protein BAUCODRAFT_226886 [Baudoinia panamericana UAMH 10762]
MPVLSRVVLIILYPRLVFCRSPGAACGVACDSYGNEKFNTNYINDRNVDNPGTPIATGAVNNMCGIAGGNIHTCAVCTEYGQGLTGNAATLVHYWEVTCQTWVHYGLNAAVAGCAGSPNLVSQCYLPPTSSLATPTFSVQDSSLVAAGSGTASSQLAASSIALSSFSSSHFTGGTASRLTISTSPTTSLAVSTGPAGGADVTSSTPPSIGSPTTPATTAATTTSTLPAAGSCGTVTATGGAQGGADHSHMKPGVQGLFIRVAG